MSEKTFGVLVDLEKENLCSHCEHASFCKIAELITHTHIDNDWVYIATLKCNYFDEEEKG